MDIVNGDTEDYDIEALAEHIQELYDNGEMSSSQYDDLMSYIQDLQYCTGTSLVSHTPFTDK